MVSHSAGGLLGAACGFDVRVFHIINVFILITVIKPHTVFNKAKGAGKPPEGGARGFVTSLVHVPAGSRSFHTLFLLKSRTLNRTRATGDGKRCLTSCRHTDL